MFGLYVCMSIHTLQSRDYHGYLEGKLRQSGDKQRPARGIAALQIQILQSIHYLDHVTKC